MDLLLRNARLTDDAALVDIAIAEGIIADVSAADPRFGLEEIDCEGRIVIPGLIEPCPRAAPRSAGARTSSGSRSATPRLHSFRSTSR